MEKKERHNYFKLLYIVQDIVADGLREVFKDEWDNKYPALPWQDNAASLNDFTTHERPVHRMNKITSTNYQNLMKTSGNRAEWDMTLLGYVLLFSRPLDLQNNPSKITLATAIDNLRNLRNYVIHQKSTHCSDTDFKRIYKAIKNEVKNLGAICTNHVVQMKAIKTTELPQDKIDRLEKERNNERKQRTRGKVLMAVVIAGFSVAIYLLYRYFQPPELPSYFPEDQIPAYFVGRQTEINDAVGTIVGGTRATVLTGPAGIGKKTTGLVVGKTLRDNHYFSICFVSLRNINDPNELQKKTLESFYIYTDTDVADRLMNVMTNGIQRKTLIIFDYIESVGLFKHYTKILLAQVVQILDWNKNIHVLFTSPNDIHVVKYEVHDIPLKGLSQSDSSALIRKMSTSVTKQEADTIGMLCGGIPILLNLYGFCFEHHQDIHPSTVITKIQGIGINYLSPWDNAYTMDLVHLLLDMMDRDTQRHVMILSIFPDSFSLEAVKELFPVTRDELTRLVDLTLLQHIGKDKSLRFIMHPLLRDIAQSRCDHKILENKNICDTFEVSFHKYFMSVVKQYVKTFLTPGADVGLQAKSLSKDEFNIKRMLDGGNNIQELVNEYYDMIVGSSALFTFGIQVGIFSRYIYYRAASSYRKSMNVGKFMTVLYVQGEKGDVYLFNHRDAYDKIQELINSSVELLREDAVCRRNVSEGREMGMCLLVQGKTRALYATMEGWSEEIKKLKNVEKGLALIDEAVNIFSDFGLKHEMADALSTKGLVKINLERYAEAIPHYVEALRILKVLYQEHQCVAATYYNIAYAYYKQGFFNILNATKLFNQSYHVYKSTLGLHRRTANAVFYTGSALQALGKYDLSLPQLRTAYDVQEKIITLHTDISKAPMDKAESLYMKHLHDEAKSASVRCAGLVVPEGINSKSCYFTYLIANCQKSLGQKGLAVSSYKLAKETSKKVCEEDKRWCEMMKMIQVDIGNSEEQLDDDRKLNTGIQGGLALVWEYLIMCFDTVLNSIFVLYAVVMLVSILVAFFMF